MPLDGRNRRAKLGPVRLLRLNDRVALKGHCNVARCLGSCD